MNKIKVAFCDDEELSLNAISGLIQNSFLIKDVEAEISKFNSLDKLNNSLIMEDYDLLILDIDFKHEFNGIDFLINLRKSGNEIPVIFISNREDLVFEAIKHKPLCYIRKKSILDDLDSYMDTIINALDTKEDTLVIKDRGKIYNIKIASISYIEASFKNQYIYFVNEDETIEISKNLRDLEEELEPKNFYRIHGSYLVNLDEIKVIDKNEVILKSDVKLPVSRAKITSLKKLFLENMKRKNIIK